jgi:hypothetical protein
MKLTRIKEREWSTKLPDHIGQGSIIEILVVKSGAEKYLLYVLTYDDSISHGRYKALVMSRPIKHFSNWTAVKDFVSGLGND